MTFPPTSPSSIQGPLAGNPDAHAEGSGGEAEQKTESGRNGPESTREASGHDHDATYIPQVHRVNYSQYKNWVTPEECRYAIDALMSGPLLENEMQQELQERLDFTTYKRKAKGKTATKKLHADRVTMCGQGQCTGPTPRSVGSPESGLIRRPF